MHALSWVGLTLIVCWALLWFTVKVAAIGVHLVLVAGLVFLLWGALRRAGKL